MKTLWIARDFNGRLYLYDNKPIQQDLAGYFDLEYGEACAVITDFSEYFSEVTWENSPQQVELKLKENEANEIIN